PRPPQALPQLHPCSQQVNIPDIVTKRWNHSLSVWSVTPITNWIIVFGGYTPYNNTAVIELSEYM
uniref:Uncharacterized protein n=1 Tax=Amphimedon queenslandica TaxID=400682 RepID=A0A1X7TGS1_AMPQE